MGPADTDAAQQLTRLSRGSTPQQALAFFDALPPVSIEQMMGAWRGSGFATGHPLDGLLEAMNWHGKRFRSAEDVDPLIMDRGDSSYALNPRFLPMGSATRSVALFQIDALRRGTVAALPLLQTSRAAARLRNVEYRGVVTATMVYDALPINDHFRLVDDTTVVGAMDMRGWTTPFMFSLHREQVPA